MAQLIVLGFKDEAAADGFVEKVKAMTREQILGLSDIVKVVRREDGKPKIHQGVNLTAAGAVSGAFWGMLIGMIFFVPWLGAAVGAASGALSGKLSDMGISDEFIKETAEKIRPGEAALFLIVEKSTPDKVAAEIEGTHATVISTNMSTEQEARLRELFPS
ncbi:MAG: DUF1269 domain-containing protein [Coriobacteriia bacterium]